MISEREHLTIWVGLMGNEWMESVWKYGGYLCSF